MAQAVKSTRRYDSPRRREQAAATRREILLAAQRLFERDGYAPTTIAAIASEARVATKTVYIAFETKSGVLRALWNLLLRGDQEEAPVGERSWYREVLDEPDPERQLWMNAHNSRVVKERIAGVLEVIRHAAPLDADIATLWERIQSDFHENQGAIVDQLAKRKALRRGLDVEEAKDVLWTLAHPDVWHLLVVERGWSPERYEEWFAETAVAQLVG
jgi:AcrR family transcriptional regulator